MLLILRIPNLLIFHTLLLSQDMSLIILHSLANQSVSGSAGNKKTLCLFCIHAQEYVNLMNCLVCRTARRIELCYGNF